MSHEEGLEHEILFASGVTVARFRNAQIGRNLLQIRIAGDDRDALFLPEVESQQLRMRRGVSAAGAAQRFAAAAARSAFTSGRKLDGRML